tara:strand:- start:101 stop:1324 length:1224 start_codon:yes stop_codon:yes gene_type:complete
MKIIKCRSCKSKKLKQAFSLGKQSLTGVFPENKKQFVTKGYLSLVICKNCSLLQLEHSFNASEMYGENYGYMSSLNQSMFEHLQNKVPKLKSAANLKSGDIIIDIGSNDGTFLSFFDKKFKLIGVDPTIRKFHKFYRNDIVKIPQFFSENILDKILNGKKAKLITSISMFYDLPDPIKFVEDVYNSLDRDGLWHLEQSYMPAMVRNISYDTICHEHLEYYSLKSIKFILDKVGFKIIDIEFNDINGGSFALTVAKNSSIYIENNKTVEWLLEKEDILNYNNLDTHKDFYQKCLKQKLLLVNLLKNLKDMKKNVLGYGASTKGNVILQFCNIDEKLIPYIGEVNKYKFNKYTPGSNIKIISEKKLKKKRPDYLLVLPWHFKNFIIKKEKKFLTNGGKLIFPLPDIEIV